MLILLLDRLCESSCDTYLSPLAEVFCLRMLCAVKSMLPGGYVGSFSILLVSMCLLDGVKAVIVSIAIAKVSYAGIGE